MLYAVPVSKTTKAALSVVAAADMVNDEENEKAIQPQPKKNGKTKKKVLTKTKTVLSFGRTFFGFGRFLLWFWLQK